MLKSLNHKLTRASEYKALFYRILLAYIFYFFARVLFTVYNLSIIEIDSVWQFLKLCYHGIAFDTTSILYVNSLFIILSILPLKINNTRYYQRALTVLYFVSNLIAYSTNFIDFIYYRFTFSRTTLAVMGSLEHESNKLTLFTGFLVRYWHVFILLVILLLLWYYFFKKVKVSTSVEPFNKKYISTSVIAFIFIAALAIGGIRGDFKKSTRPINLLDANRYVSHISQADVVLNTPFAIIRTLNSNSFQKLNYVPDDVVEKQIRPIKQYKNYPSTKPNIVIFILESYGREYVGSFNQQMKIPGYKGYTPFIDSLAQHSMIYTNAYANGHKSIHGMSSIIAGIPSFKEAFTSSPYPKQKIESLVSTLESIGYNTSFFHGATNGSMGFLGFGNILGYDNYYGKTEYRNDADFDGVWGIWDEPFFQFFNEIISKKDQPFMATMFTVSSHEPYEVPQKYKGKFPEGDVNIHKTIAYTDFALKRFFQSAQKQPWFNNTIFVLVADHGNTIFYDEYKKELMRNTVPLLFYKPGSDLRGVNEDWAQQIDIYPTILDLIGYQKPFRSWGRSLVSKSDVEPFVIKYSSNMYQFFEGDYICTFDGKKITGFYHRSDKVMERNLINTRSPKMDAMELKCKAFIQDYMQRIIDKRLTSEAR